jgi:hypothetical protein
MQTQRLVISAGLVLVAGLALVMLLTRHPLQPAATIAPQAPAAKAHAHAQRAHTSAKAEAMRAAWPPARGTHGDDTGSATQTTATRQTAASMVATAEPQAPGGADPAVPEPLGRIALGLVGINPVAEAMWVDAINNPALPAEARKNLIEDLNTNGFVDPQHPSAAELPMIQHRIVLIEQLAPKAMDAVNAAAFQEAYKDLKDMAARLAQP